MKEKKAHYGLPTATAMIIGIVVGSGIFFKGDDVLNYTGGSVSLGILVFCIGAISIIFGSLSLIELSIRTRNSGGVVGYYEEFYNNQIASAFGWFQILIYYPSLIVVVSWVAAIYTCNLFGVEADLEVQILVAVIYLIMIYAMNIFSLKLGGYFQNLSTVIKLIPLLGIAFAGIFLNVIQPEVANEVEIVATRSVGSFGWIAALIPIAYSFDGWIVATTISNEVKNPSKTMPLALLIGPLAVLGVYLLYFVGFSELLGPEFIMTYGNDAVNKAGELIFGDFGDKIMLVFLIIAVLGVTNGMTLGSIRIPQALATKKLLPLSNKIEKIHPRYELSILSCSISFVIALGWVLIHYITQKTGILGGGDVSEIAIVFSYVCYILLYVKVISLKRKGIIKSSFRGYVCPVLAIAGSVSILVGGIVSNPFYVPVFIVLCILVSMIGYCYYRKVESKNNEIQLRAMKFGE